MFHKVSKDLAKQLAPEGDLLPVCSLIDQDHFRPLYLVRRKTKQRFWKTRHRYYKTTYQLSDVLVPGQDSRNLEVQESDSITVEDCTDGRIEGTIKLPEDHVSMKATGASNTSRVKSIKVKRAGVVPADLEFLQGERKINMDHSFIKDLRKRSENLYMINEAVQALEKTTLYKSNTTEGSILNEIYVHFSLKGTRGSKKSIVIPKDCVLAFRVVPLIIHNESWAISHYPDDETFVADGPRDESAYFPGGFAGFWGPSAGLQNMPYHQHMHQITTHGYSKLEDALSVASEFPPAMESETSPIWGDTFVKDSNPDWQDGGMEGLQCEVESECAALSQLSTDLRAKFLKSIIAVIIDSDLLQELTLKLEDASEDADKCELKSENPDLEDLLNNLQDSAGSIHFYLVGPVLYTLHALGELTEDQLLQLAQSVMKQIVPKQLKLVKSILKQDFHLKEAFSLDTKLVSSLQEEELNITKAMIDLSGVKLQRNGPFFTGTGDLAAFSVLRAFSDKGGEITYFILDQPLLMKETTCRATGRSPLEEEFCVA